MAPIFYGPNICTVSRVTIGGRTVYASNDQGTIPQGFLIDATFLASLPGLCDQALGRVAAEHRICKSKVEMRVVGVLHNVTMRIQYCSGYHTYYEVTAPQVFVVEKLPVPLHVSDGLVDRKAGFSMPSPDGIEFEANTFGEPYRRHPYWGSDVMFLAHARGMVPDYLRIDTYDDGDDEGDDHVFAMLASADEFEAACMVLEHRPRDSSACSSVAAYVATVSEGSRRS